MSVTTQAKASELTTMVSGKNLLDYFHEGDNMRIAYNLYTQQFYCTGCEAKWALKWIQEQARREKANEPYAKPMPTAIYRCIDA